MSTCRILATGRAATASTNVMYRIRNKLARAIHDWGCRSILETPPLAIRRAPLVICSMVSRRDLLMYLVAMLFVIFDLEAVYLFAWAVAVPEVGWLGFGEMLVFITVLFIALAYVWRVGALNWGTSQRRIEASREEQRNGLVAQQADLLSSVGR